MSILDILLYPHPTLRKPGKLLSKADIASTEIQTLIADMTETMYHHTGSVGLAALQIGASVQIFVMDSTAKTDRNRLHVMINPVIHQQSQWKYSREGCLSFPDYLVTVKRARKLTMSWHTPESEVLTEEFLDFEAIILQHELDHLQGILFLDRVKNMQTDLILRSRPAEK
jgi:peptide deformylase